MAKLGVYRLLAEPYHHNYEASASRQYNIRQISNAEEYLLVKPFYKGIVHCYVETKLGTNSYGNKHILLWFHHCLIVVTQVGEYTLTTARMVINTDALAVA